MIFENHIESLRSIDLSVVFNGGDLSIHQPTNGSRASVGMYPLILQHGLTLLSNNTAEGSESEIN